MARPASARSCTPPSRLIGNETKTKFLHVPYRGEAPALTGMLTGDIDFIAATTGPISARVQLRRVPRPGGDRQDTLARFPDVPTVAESRLPGFEVISWTGLAGPANLPRPIVDRLNAEMRRALAIPDVKGKLEAWAAIRAPPRPTR